MAETPGHHILPEIVEVARFCGVTGFSPVTARVEDELVLTIPTPAKIVTQHQAERRRIVAMYINRRQSITAKCDRLAMLPTPTDRVSPELRARP